MRDCRQNTKGAYVYSSLPIARGGKGVYRNAQRPPITLMEADPNDLSDVRGPLNSPNSARCADIQAALATKRATNARKIRHKVPRTGDTLDSHIGPGSVAFGRATTAVQTGLYLEELKETVETDDFWTQTDQFIDRPASPVFVPAKTGIDVATQIEPYDLFDFNIEVKPILEVLVGKTIEQALLEVMEEEEIADLRKEQAILQEIHNADLAEIARLEERNRRYREEQARRRRQAEHAAILRQETADKIAARCFVKAYLEPLLPTTFEQLMERGYFYDAVQHEIDENFYTPMLENVLDNNVRERRARILVDGIIQEAVTQRYQAFRELGRELMTEVCVERVIPQLRSVINFWVFDRMNKLAFSRLTTAADARKSLYADISEAVLNEALDEFAVYYEQQLIAAAAAKAAEEED
uniref:Radial spoke head protein 3 homolog n=1 Tax=Schistocephalus solidus TaxID=70667 RepID=A0A0X3P530_SCHSO